MNRLIKSAMLALLLGAALAIFSWLPSVQAVDPPESITLSPISRQYEVKPGQVLKDTVTVLNDGQSAYDFIVYATPYSVSNESYDPNFSDTLAGADAYEWIEFEKTLYHIKPRQTIHVPYTVRVKPDATPGGHYGAIFVETQASGDSGNLVREKRLGSIVYATVAGKVVHSGEVTDVSIAPFQSTAPLKASVRVKNTGTTDFRAPVSYVIKDVFGRVLYDSKAEFAVLPQTTRQIDLEWNNASWFGLYRIEVSATALESQRNGSSLVLMIPTWLLLILAASLFGGAVYAFQRHKK